MSHSVEPAAPHREGESAWSAPPFQGVLRCPETGEPLRLAGSALHTGSGRIWPVVGGIPRFVADDLYVKSFSYEWNTHRTTQLDSITGSGSSEDIFRRKTGLSPEDVRDKLVLDAGIGAGRFTDVLLRWGAWVVGMDLSFAVEAASATFRGARRLALAQADIGRPPFADGTFDVVISIGVLHHTPDTRRHFEKLVALVKPGGSVCIWVYPSEGDYLIRSRWIPFTSRLPATWLYRWSRVSVQLSRRHRTHPLVQYFRRHFPMSDQGLGVENDILDTFDGYSPRYHWVHSPDEVKGWFQACGLTDIQSLSWNTAVRGRRPRG